MLSFAKFANEAPNPSSAVFLQLWNIIRTYWIIWIIYFLLKVNGYQMYSQKSLAERKNNPRQARPSVIYIKSISDLPCTSITVWACLPNK